MACKKKKQKGMVLHQEAATSSAVPPAAKHPPAHFVNPKPEKASEGGWEWSNNVKVIDREANMTGKGLRTSGALPVVKHLSSPNPPQDNLSPVSVCRGIRVMLDNNSMWNEFFRCRTEMILTKQGSRMFPYCRFHISGLQPSRKYSLIMDIQPLDDSCYKWTGRSWQAAGKAESHVKSQLFFHPESPSLGQHWMQSPVSFYRLKLTNSVSDQEGNIILHPMHSYLPRLHIIQTDKDAKDIKVTGASVVTFTFPQTEFLAVTAYQNSKFAQLIVDYNPFAKGMKEDKSSTSGLKLKLNSGKETHKGEVKGTNDNPVKKSLKSLLANHRPRGSKAVVLNSSVSGDSTNQDPPPSEVPAESLCISSRPAPKLFSEVIREAHVSLQRCDLDQLNINNGSYLRTEQTNREGVPERDDTHSNTSASENSGHVSTLHQVEAIRNCLNIPTSEGNIRKDYCEVTNVVTAPLVFQKSSADSDHQSKPEAPSEANVKQQQPKRPVPLPLPALALFLKQHSTKSKKTKKMDSPPSALQPESKLQSSNTTSPSIHHVDDVKQCKSPSSGSKLTDVVSEPAVKTAPQPSSPSHPESAASAQTTVPSTDDPFVSVSIPNSLVSDQAGPDCTTVLCTLGTCISTMSSLLATSAAPSPALSPHLDTVLNVLNSPYMPPIMGSSTLPSDSATIKSDLLLPDPESSSFGFEPLSPASSPEPLPALPDALTFELDSTNPDLSQKPGRADGSPQRDDSSTSVFKWHTVIPPPGPPYIDTSFTTFQPQPQTLSLVSVTSPLLPSPSPSIHETQSLEPTISMAPPDPSPLFQDSEQSLPFPAELSPLILHLPLSPTFSSLDGDPLSPTPSLTELVHFFSTNSDLGMGAEFSNSDTVVVPPPTPPDTNIHKPSQPVQPVPARNPSRSRKKSKRRKPTVAMDEKVDESAYISMQPNLEEVEEQLFISFTSKEALKLHISDSFEEPLPHPQTTPGVHPLPPADTPDNAETLQKISTCETLLLKALKLMKHRQVIHPVLQEVGLKMNLLDPSLAIDLQYLGVRLPLPPPGHCVQLQDQDLPSSQGVSAAFVSRTGKTTDVTQIKGWREKFIPSEAPSTPSSTKPEAVPFSDQPKKNLSAFCSDMLDEYLENEGKLIDERAASFSQPQAEPVMYKLPIQSSSYVRTLDHVLKKHGMTTPTSDLISGFIPPSKRPKPSLKERKTQQKEKSPKQTRLQPEPASASGSTQDPPPAEPTQVLKHPAGTLLPSDHLTPITEPSRSQKLKVHLNHTEPSTVSPETHTLKKKKRGRRRLKPNTSSKTLSPLRTTISRDLAPLESDSELSSRVQQGDGGKDGPPLMTRALLRQKDLEDGVVWEGRPRTTITKERAAIALTSLFTLMGFVDENPTAPIQLVRRRAPPCLNDFCRLGCVCSSLAYCSRISHCGQIHCMFGCSCLKQKVVLLKNLDASDSSPSHQSHGKRRKRKRRMKMAYVLMEADSVSQPAERVRVLWKKDSADSNPEPIYIPELLCSTRFTTQPSREVKSSCARVRGYWERRRSQKPQDETQIGKFKSVKQQHRRLKESKVIFSRPPPPPPSAAAAPPPPAAVSEAVQTTVSNLKPSKRLILLSECKWASDADRNHVLKRLCEVMAQDQLDSPFWVREYLITPISQDVEDKDGSCCVQYKVHISRPRQLQELPTKPDQRGDQKIQQEQVSRKTEPLQNMKKEKPLEDWQREVEEEEELSPCDQVVMKGREAKTKEDTSLALPFLTGISPAGFLSARRKEPGQTDHLVEVNGKYYPLAKIQLGKMGALHPANRLAAYLTGRVGSTKTHLSSAQPTKTQSSDPTPLTQTVSVTVSNVITPTMTLPQPQQTVAVPLFHTSSSASQVSSSVAPPVTLVPGVQPLPGLKFVPRPCVKVSVPGTASQSSGLPSPGQSRLLQPLYRLSNGKLIQLVPLNKARAESSTQLVLQGSQTASLAMPPSLPSLSGLQSFSISSPLSPDPGFLSQKGMRTFKIIPASSTKEPIFVTCHKPPPLPLKMSLTPATIPPLKIKSPGPSGDITSPKPSAGKGVEPSQANQTVPPPSPAASPQPSAVPGSEVTPAPPSQPPASPGSEVTPGAPPPPAAPGSELACGPVDLDIICVDDDVEPVAIDTWFSTEGGSSSGETENSSDFGDESNSGDEKEMMKNHRHNMLERNRRTKMTQLFRRLRTEVGLNDDKTPKVSTLKKAVQMIQELRSTEMDLRIKTTRLKEKRNKYLSTLIPTSKSVLLSSQQRKKMHKRCQTVNQLPAGGGASDSDIIMSSNLPQKTPQAPATRVSAPPNTTRVSIPVQTAVPTLVHKPVPVYKLIPVKTAVHKPVPGQAAVPTLVHKPVPLQTAVPTSVHKPVQQVSSVAPSPVSRSPLVVRDRPRTIPNILSRSKNPQSPLTKNVEGVASVTLNVPSLTNQQIHVTSLLPPPTSDIYSSSAPFTFSHLSALELLHMVQNAPKDTVDPHLLTSARSDLLKDHKSLSALSSDLGSGPDGGLVGPDSESFTPLLNEIVFLNQQTVPMATVVDNTFCSEGEYKELDFEDTGTMETKETGLQGHTQMTQSTPTSGNIKGGVLAPPPLLQMKVGRDNMTEPISSDKLARGEPGGRGKVCVAWRPMPRLVPLGLRGSPPT